MATTDRLGLPISTASPAAAAHYQQGIDFLLAFWPGAAAALDEAIERDDNFALALAARARLSLLQSEPHKAKQMIGRARDAVAVNGTDRERSHVEVVRLGIEGTPAQTLKLALSHISQWPRDALIMSLPLGGIGLFASSGMPDHDQARVDLCEQYAGNYDDDWWFESHRGWAHTENGNVAHGRRLAERALALKRENATAAHALAHGLFESGAPSEADAFIADWLLTYDRCGALHGHLSWHQALAALDEGDVDRAIKLYEDQVQPSAATSGPPVFVLADCASFLWRLDLYGHNAGKARWGDAATFVERAFSAPGFAFADAHIGLVAAATGNGALFDAWMNGIGQRAREAKYPSGEVVPEICRGLMAFAAGNYRECAAHLEPVSHDFIRIGGSHAQREVFEDTLIVALLRADEPAKARSVLQARLHRRPSQRDETWHSEAVRKQ